MLALDLDAIAGGASAVRGLKVRSALNPVLWLVGISVPFLLIAAYHFKEYAEICHLLIYTTIGVIILACFGFIFLLLFKPEKLQSEEYQLRHEAMLIYQTKSENFVATEDEKIFLVSSTERTPTNSHLT